MEHAKNYKGVQSTSTDPLGAYQVVPLAYCCKQNISVIKICLKTRKLFKHSKLDILVMFPFNFFKLYIHVYLQYLLFELFRFYFSAGNDAMFEDYLEETLLSSDTLMAGPLTCLF